MTRALIVDDDACIRRLLRKLLKTLCLAVQEAKDGEQGMALMEQEVFDLVIVDYRMPRMDGMEMLRQCRRRFPEHPCIVISGEYPEGIAQLEKVFFLQKPFDASRFLNLVRRLLDLDSPDLT